MRKIKGKKSTPSVGVMDSQTVKTTESGDERGYDGGKKINGRKCYIMVDTLGPTNIDEHKRLRTKPRKPRCHGTSR